MHQKLYILGVITARGGSKRFPEKNIKPLAGKPLIAYAIEAMCKSILIDRTIVSTEDEKISHIAKKYGADVPFMRPYELATDLTPHIPVMQHAVTEIEKKGNKPSLIVLVQPTSPMIQTQDIDNAIKKLVDEGTNSCISVCRISERPEHMYRIENGISIPLIKRDSRETIDQTLPRYMRINGAVYVTRYDTLMKQGKIIDDQNNSMIEMPRERSVDINEPIDFKIAETLLSLSRYE